MKKGDNRRGTSKGGQNVVGGKGEHATSKGGLHRLPRGSGPRGSVRRGSVRNGRSVGNEVETFCESEKLFNTQN